MRASLRGGSFCADIVEKALDQYREICYEQPRPLSSLPKVDTFTSRPQSRTSHRPSQWLVEGRNLASRASNRASFTRRTVPRRPTIGAPSDFRKVERPLERMGGFRPLELSIYLPGNELPSLPTFSYDYVEGEVGLVYPAPVLTKAKSESLLSRPSTSFTIARKPVKSRTLSFDGSRSSWDSRHASVEINSALCTRPIVQRPSLATTQSTQDFLDTLDTRLPQLPSRLRSKSGSEPAFTLYRRASEQSLRLRTHVEERERIERRLPECDTILEEKQMEDRKFPNLSPISSHDDDPADDRRLIRPRSELESMTCLSSLSASPRSHTSLEILHEFKLPVASSDPPNARTRISQWLLRSTSAPSAPSVTSSSDEICHHRSSIIRVRTSTGSSTYSSAETVDPASPWSSPRSSPHRKGSSISSWQTGMYCRGLSIDVEKRPALPTANVGVAF